MHRYGLMLLLLAGCAEDRPFKQAMKLGGKEISAERLNHGRDGYQQYCRPCHGDNGDGKGNSSYGLRPPPRDFTQGLFKFGHVAAPALPPDEELTKIVREGLHGTAMLKWDVSEGELPDILQYIKTFSPKWATEPVGTRIEASPDPFKDKPAEGVALGKKIYHAKAQCSGCHPSYVTHEELFSLTKEQTGTGQTEFTEGMYHSQIKDSEYCLEWKPGWKKLEDRECAKVVKILPPDFTREALRTVHPGKELDDLYLTIAAGIGGANMPTWKGALPENELWGLAYYVRSLVALRGTPEAMKLSGTLNAPANLSWKPDLTGAAPPVPQKAPAPTPAPKPDQKPERKG